MICQKRIDYLLRNTNVDFVIQTRRERHCQSRFQKAQGRKVREKSFHLSAKLRTYTAEEGTQIVARIHPAFTSI